MAAANNASHIPVPKVFEPVIQIDPYDDQYTTVIKSNAPIVPNGEEDPYNSQDI